MSEQFGNKIPLIVFGLICETIRTLYMFDTINFAKFMVKNLICWVNKKGVNNLDVQSCYEKVFIKFYLHYVLDLTSFLIFKRILRLSPYLVRAELNTYHFVSIAMTNYRENIASDKGPCKMYMNWLLDIICSCILYN